MPRAKVDDEKVISDRCPYCDAVVNQRFEFCPSCGYGMHPAAQSVSLWKAIVAVVVALYGPAIPVLMAMPLYDSYGQLCGIVFWPVAWLAVVIDSQSNRMSTEAACLLPLIAMIAIFASAIKFAKMNRVTLVLTFMVLAALSSLQALFAFVIISSISA